jgi:hypothetical protein
VHGSPAAARVKQVHVQVLYFAGCPNYERAQELVAQVAAALGAAPRLELFEVADARAAVALRFLGSPTIRVDGHDVEPGADAREDFAFACRVYRTPRGELEVPDPTWIRRALVTASHADGNLGGSEPL